MTPDICLPISVIVPTYNDDDYFTEALTSILEQTRPPAALIVVDDGSDTSAAENSVKALQAKGNFSTQIIYLKQHNQGPSAARNAGLQLVVTPFVTFLDADDRMLPDNLATMYQAIEALSDDYFGVYGTYSDFETGKPYAYGNLDGCIAADRVGKKHGAAGGVHCYLFRTHNVVAVKGFDENLINNEDFDLIIRLLKAGLKCKGKIAICFEKRARLGSLSRPWQPYQAFENTLQFLRKAEEYNYFSSSELQKRRCSAQLSYAKRLMEQGNEVEAKAVWRVALRPFPSSPRELYHWMMYLYLKLKL